MKIGRNQPCICGSNKKYKKCCLFKVNSGQYQVINTRDWLLHNQKSFKKAKIAIKFNNTYKSLFILTTTKDKSLIIDPSAYANFGNWRVAHYTIPPAPVKNQQISPDKDSLVQCGMIGPKFTYHKSGWVTAGKTGKIEGLRIQATPLPAVVGHVFTIMFQGFEGFKDADISDKKYTYIIPLMPTNLNNLKIVGYAGPLENYTVDENCIIPSNTRNIRLITKRGEQDIETTYIRIIFDDKSLIWLKLEFIPNFQPQKVKGPSVNAIVGWDQFIAQDKDKEFKMIGIAGGGDF